MVCLPNMSLKVLLSLLLVITSREFVELKDGSAAAAAAATDSKYEIDRISLLSFRKEIASDPLGILNSWNGSSDLCQWKGVTCGRRHRRVTSLALRGSGLAGWITPSIGNLTFLRSIDLANNSFYGKIPEEIGRLFRLQHLNLDNNSLAGGIPSNLSQCFHLRRLYISRNNLEGKIPVELTMMSKLTELKLLSNNLSGELPHSIGNLSSLEKMSVAFNNLEGRIPSSIAQLKSLLLLAIGVNRFHGEFPAMIYNMSSLIMISMASNKLHGNLPQDIVLTLPNLKFLLLPKNQFTGTIPKLLSNASKLQDLDLSLNNFVGRIPSGFGSLQSLKLLNLELNHLGSDEASGFDFDFISSLTDCKSLEVLAIDGNVLQGVLPNPSFSNLSTQLHVLNLGRNQIHGNIPTSIGNLTSLTTLGLEKNHFTGSIPSLLGNLRNLEGLSLYGNKLIGNIPLSIGNMSLLSRLILGKNHLNGTIPSTLAQCKNLERLILSENKLSGTIPKQVLLTGFSSLMTLDVSMNSLSGPLPLELGNLKNIWYLDVSQNMFNSEIPATLGSCAGLEFLFLEGNFLVGEIPMTLNALKGLVDLDLSKNNLSGPIPKYLESFPLEYLNVSFNNLEGEVPNGGVFGNSSAVFVSGNTKLCGGIVELHLPKCNVKQPPMKQGRSFHLKILIAVISVVVGCLLLAFVLKFFLMKRKKKLSSMPSMDKFDRIKLSYGDLFKATNGFSTTSLIGSGSFGSVYKGVLSRDETIVAVKVFHLQQRGSSKTFRAECNTLRNIRHRNLVKILTSCSSIDSKGNDFKALIFEFMPNGSLEQWLHPRHDSQLRKLSLIQRMNILVDVASALDYLHHHCHQIIVHCDLKPSNILLDADMTAHVGDFGLARFFSQPHQHFSSIQSSTIGIKGSIGYSAPEYGIGGEASTQGDVYSFGILLLEMVTGRRPTDEMFTDGLNLHIFAKTAIAGQVMQILDRELLISEETMTPEEHTSTSEEQNHRRHRMKECAIGLMKIGVECSKESPRERVDMRDVIKELHLIRSTFLDVRTIGAVSSTII
ncbi:hypothetical protein Sjap_006205 [Stephania japonica]|uniref:non-specific serine/threonine protein kinase n=1 Tax=Stephania japonica TaxID=461633 RepID=A0AAP0PJI6_9MAGN